MMKHYKPWITPVVVLFVVFVVWQSLQQADPSAEFIAARKERFSSPSRAYQRCLTLLETTPDETPVLLLAGELAERLDRPEDAFNHYLSVVSVLPEQSDALQRVARLGGRLGRLNDTRRALQALTLMEPQNPTYNRQYADLLLILGRRVESIKPLFLLVRNKTFLLDELVMLGSTEELLEDRRGLELARTHESEKAAALTGLGRLEAYSNKFPEAIQFLSQAVECRDDVPEDAIAALGRAYLSINDIDQLRLWMDRHAPKALDHPDTQFVMAQTKAMDGLLQDAIVHLNKAIQLQPNHRAACQLLGSIVAESGDKDGARPFLSRAAALDEVEKLLRRLLFKHRDAAIMRRTAELMEELGRSTEAWAWWIALQTYHPQDSPGAAENAERLSKLAATAQSQVDPTVAAGLEYRKPLAIASKNTSPVEASKSPVLVTQTQIRFKDVAPQLGLTTPYFGGFGEEPRGLWLYQVDGGGVAVTDFERDGQPDLYFVQGGPLPSDKIDPRDLNQLFRNSASAGFRDVSGVSSSNIPGLCQGATVGDYDSDGFEDLYVANIGVNRLLHNNGDGTYSDVTPDSLKQMTNWTTSCLMADLNGDGLDDLFDVNYLAGQEPFVHTCFSGPNRVIRACGPDIFEGDPDQCLLNDGTGGFINVTATAGIQDNGGPGLGIVAADFDESGTIDLFVANDMKANFYFINNGNGSNGIPGFSEEALLRGCALNGAGRAEACMGIASGDVTEDGYLDLYVTNFLQETNTLYSYSGRGFFDDITQSSGASEGTLSLLSFGTQFVDADLDSHQDVLFVNGHVDDYSHLDVPWKMMPSALRNGGTGQFQRLPQESMGDYGLVPRLGRAMARLDWNSDGKDDLIVTHLDGPPALLSNTSESAGNSLSLCFTGTNSNRAGIGSVIRIVFAATEGSSEIERVFHLSAGDGYYCSNQRKITIGLGSAQVAKKISVKWLSGDEQQFENVAAGTSYHMVEGRPILYRVDDQVLSESQP